MTHPFRGVAIAGVYNTVQARSLPNHDSLSIAIDAAIGALADSGLETAHVDGVIGERSGELVYELRLGPCRRSSNGLGIPAVLEAAALIATGQCRVVLVVGGSAGLYTDRGSTAPWTRPTNEFVVGYGMFTAVEFALMAKRHMLTFGTTSEQLAIVAATIRNNGHDEPRSRLRRSGPVHSDGYPGLAADRRTLPPAGLLNHIGGGLRAGYHCSRAGRRPPVDSVMDPRWGKRRLWPRLPARSRLGLPRPGPRHSGRLRRSEGGASCLRLRRTVSERRGRLRAL